LGVWPEGDELIFKPALSSLKEARGYLPNEKLDVKYLRDGNNYKYIINSENNTRIRIALDENKITVNGKSYDGEIYEGKDFEIIITN